MCNSDWCSYLLSTCFVLRTVQGKLLYTFILDTQVNRYIFVLNFQRTTDIEVAKFVSIESEAYH